MRVVAPQPTALRAGAGARITAPDFVPRRRQKRGPGFVEGVLKTMRRARRGPGRDPAPPPGRRMAPVFPKTVCQLRLRLERNNGDNTGTQLKRKR